MPRYIDADALGIGRCNPDVFTERGYADGWNSVIDLIEAAPTADVAPVVHGEWKKLDMHRGMEQYRCSICRSEAYVPTCMDEPMYAYCPNCGAKMDGGEDE